MRDTFINHLFDLTAKNQDIMFITADLGYGSFNEFASTFPQNFLNVGVCEQNMIGVATGIALEGRTVFTYSIGNFATLRCLEQIRVDACYHDADVKIIAMGGGYSYGVLGMSHHMTEDLSILRALPNLIVTCPSTLQEVVFLTEEFSKNKVPSYMRLDKSHAHYEGDKGVLQVGKAHKISEGKTLTVFTCGGILQEVLKASDQLKKKGISLKIFSIHTLKPLDIEAIKEACLETGGILTVEENNLIGGLGSAVAEACLDLGLYPRVFKRLGIKDKYLATVGNQEYLREISGLSSKHITQSVLELIDR